MSNQLLTLWEWEYQSEMAQYRQIDGHTQSVSPNSLRPFSNPSTIEKKETQLRFEKGMRDKIHENVG